jgi:hypothetical protein
VAGGAALPQTARASPLRSLPLHHLHPPPRNEPPHHPGMVDGHVAPWPATPIIAGRWSRVLCSAGVAILSASLASLAFVLIQHEGWAFRRLGTFGRVFWTCHIALLVVPGVAWFAGTKMHRAETAAKCLREGHQWKCSRTGCSLRADDGKQSRVASLDVEKEGKEEAALEVKTAPWMVDLLLSVFSLFP